MSDPEVLRSMIFDVIKNQIRDATPPETKETGPEWTSVLTLVRAARVANLM